MQTFNCRWLVHLWAHLTFCCQEGHCCWCSSHCISLRGDWQSVGFCWFSKALTAEGGTVYGQGLSCHFHCLSPAKVTAWRARAWRCWAQQGDDERVAATRHVTFCIAAQNRLWPFAQFIKVFNADFDLILPSAGEIPMPLAINHLLEKIKSAVLSAPLPGYYFSCPDGSTQITSWLNSTAINWSRSFHFFQTSNASTLIS